MKSKKGTDFEIDIVLFKELVDELSDMGTETIALLGDGEPSFHPKITEILNYIKSKGLHTSIQTNGLFSKEGTIRELESDNIDYILINLSAATKKTYENLRPGHRKDYDLAIRNVKDICDYKRKHSLRTHIRIAFVINELNWMEVEDMLKLAIELGVDYIDFKMMRSAEDTESILISSKSIKKLKTNLNQIIRKKYKVGSNIDDILCILNDPSFLSHRNDLSFLSSNIPEGINCYNGWFYASINKDGSISPCCTNYFLTLGNLHGKDFRNIWDSKEFNEFRKQAKYSLVKNMKRWKKCNFCVHKQTNENVHFKILEIMEDHYDQKQQ
jgi:radical SAM protein with 4Fe4S-binding SPASM domain